MAQREDWDRAIIGHLRPYLLESARRKIGTKIGAYWPIRNEPDLRGLLAELDEAGFEIGLPRVTSPDAPLQFLRWRRGSVMREDAFKVAVPDGGEGMVPELLLIPCVGFIAEADGRIFRLGYGGGHYDRTLSAQRMANVGVAYECGRIGDKDGFIPQAHDASLERIVTEAGMT